jgi:molybdenum cofactor cytidylyltransferase
MPYGDDTIIKSIADKAVMSKAEEIVVVLGSDAEDVKTALEGLPVDFEYNENYKEGMLSSVQRGFTSLPGRMDAAVLLLGDQPMLPDHIIDELIEAYRDGQKHIIIPVFEGKRGHPILIDLKYLNEINQINPEVGLRDLMSHHVEDILELEVNTSAVLKDIDTPEDYKKELT